MHSPKSIGIPFRQHVSSVATLDFKNAKSKWLDVDQSRDFSYKRDCTTHDISQLQSMVSPDVSHSWQRSLPKYNQRMNQVCPAVACDSLNCSSAFCGLLYKTLNSLSRSSHLEQVGYLVVKYGKRLSEKCKFSIKMSHLYLLFIDCLLRTACTQVIEFPNCDCFNKASYRIIETSELSIRI